MSWILFLSQSCKNHRLPWKERNFLISSFDWNENFRDRNVFSGPDAQRTLLTLDRKVKLVINRRLTFHLF